MVVHNITVACLILGLLLGVSFIVMARRLVGGKARMPRGVFNLACAFSAAAPALLIKLEVIEQTATTVTLAIAYFLVFIVGSMAVNAKAFRQDHERRI